MSNRKTRNWRGLGLKRSILKDKKKFKQYIIEGKTELEISKIYNCSPALIQLVKKELSLMTKNIHPNNPKNIKHTHNCKYCNKINNSSVCHNCTAKRQRIAKKEILVEYSGGQCVMCGYNKCIGALDFHHLDPNKKDMELSRVGINIVDKIKESKKCQLLCANCHREVHWDISTKDFEQNYREEIDKTKINILNSIKSGKRTYKRHKNL